MKKQEQADLRSVEKEAAGELQLGFAVAPMAICAIGLVSTFFLPHSGQVLGFDVLFDTDIAEQNFTMVPERIYTIVMLVTVLLTFATIFTRTSILSFVTWIFSGISAVYSVFAGWMRQSRPPEQLSDGISYGLGIGIFFSLCLLIVMSFVTFKKSRAQTAIESARRKEADEDPVLRAQQQYLRQGVIPNTHTDTSALEDDRRSYSRRRREQAEKQHGEK